MARQRWCLPCIASSCPGCWARFLDHPQALRCLGAWGALSMQARKVRLHVLKQRSCCFSPEPSSSRGTLTLFYSPLLSLPWPYAALNIPVCLFVCFLPKQVSVGVTKSQLQTERSWKYHEDKKGKVYGKKSNKGP